MVKGVLPGQSAGLDTSDIRNRGGEEKLTPANKSAPKKTAFRYHSTAERERKGQGAPSQRSSKYHVFTDGSIAKGGVCEEVTIIENFEVEREEVGSEEQNTGQRSHRSTNMEEEILEEGKVKTELHSDKLLVQRTEEEEEMVCENLVSLKLKIAKVLKKYEARVEG